MEISSLEEFLSLFDDYFSVEDIHDRIIWTPSVSGNYTCKSFRIEFSLAANENPVWKIMWQVSVLLEVKTFIWLLLRDRSPI